MNYKEQIIEGGKRMLSGGLTVSTFGNLSLLGDDGYVYITPSSIDYRLIKPEDVCVMDLNGNIIDRKTGPINGFDRPVDIIRLQNGNLLVSESAGDRLSLLNNKGNFIRYIGEKGRGLGQMIGPQYLAQDDMGNIYVSDYGNRRIDVFDSEGNPLFFFGGRQGDFKGLKGPTGIIVKEDSVFVADDHKGCIYEFDRSGNYLRYLCEEKTFSKPESLRFWNNRILVCDINRVIGITTDTGSLFEYGKSGNSPSRLNCAVADANSNIIVTDFKANEIYMMSEIQELVGGMFVQIDNVNADNFPNVTVEVKVENRHREPVVGLTESNFYLSENKRGVSSMKLTGAAFNNTYSDITFIIDRSIYSSRYSEQIDSALREIAASMENKGAVRIISAGRVPVTEYTGNAEGCRDFSSTGLKNPVSSEVSLDLALRLAANDLVNGEKKRSIILLTAGNVTNGSFSHYNLAELTSFLNNNSINFAVVQMAQGAVASEINYLVENTRGEQYYVFRPEGLGQVIKDLNEVPEGVYQLSFVSALPTNYGENYLPLEVEVYLLNRSGRDESGYFAPLK